MSTEENNEAVAPTSTDSSTPKQTARAKRLLSLPLIAGVVLLAVLLGAGYLYTQGKLNLPASLMGGAERGRAAEVVARVDGSEITRGELDKRTAQASAASGATPGAPVDAALEQQVLDELINMQLILNVAASTGITVTDEAIDTEVANIIASPSIGSEGAFEEQLGIVGLTREELRENIRNDLTARSVINANTEVEQVTVSDEDVRAAYDENVAGQEGAPAFEEIEAMIRQNLQSEQSGVLVSAYLEELRGKAKIEVLL